MRVHAARERLFDESPCPYLSVEAAGLTWLVATADRSVGRRLFVKQSRPEFAVLARAMEHVRAGGVFVDVGANIGTACLPSLRWFDSAVAIEPDPLNVRLLRANAALNGEETRVTVIERACSDRNGVATLRLAAGKHGNHSVGSTRPGQPSVEVPCSTVDAILSELGVAVDDVGMLWVDVEGHEVQVLEGAAGLIAAGVPAVFEVRDRNRGPVAAVLPTRTLLDLRDPGRRSFTDILALAT